MDRISSKSLDAILISLIILGAAGCGQAEPARQVLPTIAPTTAISLEPTSTPPGDENTPEDPHPAPDALDRTSYTLIADLDYQNHTLNVTEQISIPHPGNEALGSLSLVVPPANWRDVFSLRGLDAENHPLVGYYLVGVQLKIQFEDPGWLPGEVLDLQIDFDLELPPLNEAVELGHTPFGFTSRQMNLVDWYPMVPPYQEGLGWLIHPPWEFGEFLVYPSADFEVQLTLNEPGLVVAASTIPTEQKDGTAWYSLQRARNFVFSISPSYQILETEVNGTRVLGYVFPNDLGSGQAALNATQEALSLYSDLYGPYSQPSISMVQADFSGSMEYEGLYMLNKDFFGSYNNSKKSFLILIAVHETAHQWWYGQVANDQALEPWLDEALCTFSELAYFEHLSLPRENWWWKNRVDYYQPAGRINRSIYQYQDFKDNPYLAYRNATYLQGAKFLSTLKDEMGDEVFYSFLREYALHFQDQIVTGEDFFNLLGEYVEVGEMEWAVEYFE